MDKIASAVSGRIKGRKEKERSESLGNIRSIEELWKRKRDESGGENDDVFKRSKLTARSPEKEGDLGKMICEMKEMKSMIGKVGEEIREQGNKLREEMEEWRREYREQMKEWRVEKKALREEIESLVKRMEGLEAKVEEGRKEKKGAEGGKGGRMERRVKEIDWRWELREREERKKNIVVRGLEVREGKRREGAEKLLKDIEAKVEIMEVKKVGEDREKGSEMVIIRLGSEEQKWEVMEKKKKLRGRKERIGADLTWRERRTKWKLGEIARREEMKGERTRVGQGRIKIGEKWWKWDEEEEVLKNGNGRVRKTEEGEGREVAMEIEK